jgi:hypothetical protein
MAEDHITLEGLNLEDAGVLRFGCPLIIRSPRVGTSQTGLRVYWQGTEEVPLGARGGAFYLGTVHRVTILSICLELCFVGEMCQRLRRSVEPAVSHSFHTP